MMHDHSQFRLTPKQKEGNVLLSSTMHVLLRGGSRSGKTFLILRAMFVRAMKAPNSHHAVFRFRRNAIEDSVWKTAKDVVRLCFPDLLDRIDWKVSTFTITLPNGSEIVMLGLDDKERVDKILGQEFSTLFFNECTQIPWPSIETALSRLAEKTTLKLRAWFDCNPTTKLHWTFHLFRKFLKPKTREKVDRADYAEMRINPDDNRENISEQYFEILDRMSAAKRKRFRDGEWADATDGALWTIEAIEAQRKTVGDTPDLERIVIAVDPSGAGDDSDGSDDIGIVAAGLDAQGRYYVLGDHSVNTGPSGWAERVVEAYHAQQADRVVAEVNYGGAMVKAVIRVADPNIPFKAVTASRGKIVRAEPVSALYDAGRVSHVGEMPDLEDQLCAMTTKGFIGEGSPDRADALVWALTDLMAGGGAKVRMRSL